MNDYAYKRAQDKKRHIKGFQHFLSTFKKILRYSTTKKTSEEPYQYFLGPNRYEILMYEHKKDIVTCFN